MYISAERRDLCIVEYNMSACVPKTSQGCCFPVANTVAYHKEYTGGEAASGGSLTAPGEVAAVGGCIK